jgi:tRNA (guanine37-N1)-methyltransferase
MRIAIVTLFPQLIRDAFKVGVVGRALSRGGFSVDCFDPRDHTHDVHRTVDDRPYGGGPGMVMKIEPLRGAVHEALKVLPAGCRRVYLGADGRKFDQAVAREACQWPGLLLVAGRYEGVDERFIEAEIDEQWSIGDYVLSGGELPALVVIDAIAGQRGVGDFRIVQRRLGGLAALYAAAGHRRARGAGGAGIGRSRGDRTLALEAGAGPNLAAAA